MYEDFAIVQAELTHVPEIIRIWSDGAQDALGKFVEDGERNYEDFFHQKVQNQDIIFQIWVAVSSDKSVLGWQSLSPITNNPVVRNLMAESSTYICLNRRKKGIGKALVEHAMKHAKNTSLQYVVAFVNQNNKIVLDTAIQIGWQCIGTFPASPKAELPIGINFIVYVVPKTD